MKYNNVYVKCGQHISVICCQIQWVGLGEPSHCLGWGTGRNVEAENFEKKNWSETTGALAETESIPLPPSWRLTDRTDFVHSLRPDIVVQVTQKIKN